MEYDVLQTIVLINKYELYIDSIFFCEYFKMTSWHESSNHSNVQTRLQYNPITNTNSWGDRKFESNK